MVSDTGFPFVALHGANGAAAEIAALVQALEPYGAVFAPDLPGHGGRPLPPRLDLREFAADVLGQLDARDIEQSVLVGYSLGGYLALYLARHHPQRVQAACAIATRPAVDPEALEHWTHLASVERLSRPGNPRAAVLERVHAPNDWREVARANQRLFADLAADPPMTEADFGALARPVMLVGGSRDQLVSWPLTRALGRMIPGAKLVMFYGRAHPLALVPVHPVARALADWLRTLPARGAA